MDIEKFVTKAEKAEKEIEELSKELKTLLSEASGSKSQSAQTGAVPEELEKLRTENTKLKYRLGILQRATEEASKGKKKAAKAPRPKMNPKDFMPSVLNELEHVFGDAVTEAFPDVPDAPCPITVSAKFGDYQFNGAMAISGLLKGQGVKMPPRDVANKVLEKIDVNASNIIEKLEVAGPGFVNIFIKKSYVLAQIEDLLKFGARAPHLDFDPKKQRVVVDFSSPNIAKEMHVGHLRSTIIGDSVGKKIFHYFFVNFH